jgi:hypothetical protein
MTLVHNLDIRRFVFSLPKEAWQDMNDGYVELLNAKDIMAFKLRFQA